MAVKVGLNSLGPDVIAFIESGGGGGGGSLMEEIKSNVTVGAANAGTLFPQYMNLTDFAKALLLKDIIPTISATFTGSGVKEKGTKVNGSTITLTITNAGSVTVPIQSVNFYDGSILLETKPYVSGQNSYSYNYTGTIENDKTLKVELVYGSGQKLSSSGNFQFVYASYYGVTDKASVSTADANLFAQTFQKNVKTGKGLTWKNINLNDQRFCYLYPASFGALSSIKDGNGFEQISSYTKTEVMLTSPIDGTTVKYYCYLLTDSATGNNFTQVYA